MSFTIIPAIDLRAGCVVRLFQGDYARQTDYPLDPLALAQKYAEVGAECLHVVDLDGALEGKQHNLPVIAALVRAGMKVQAGGGIRNEDDLARLFDVGVARAVVGSVAVRDPDRVCEWLQKYGAARVVIALDARLREGTWSLCSAGWTADEVATLDELAPRYAAAGARHVLCTDIDRDGTLAGPNLDLYAHLRRIAPTLAVQVSGGVRDCADIRAVREVGASAVVLGKALLEGHIDLAGALAETAVPC